MCPYNRACRGFSRKEKIESDVFQAAAKSMGEYTCTGLRHTLRTDAHLSRAFVFLNRATDE